nr:hypothetical protein [Tanacetum cinerariifolium]
MDPNPSLRKICLGDDVIVISSNRKEGSGDWNSPEYQDTAGSKGKNVINALNFYKTEIYEVSERYIASCFVNGLEAYDEEDDVEPGLILGRSFMRLAKRIVDFGNGVVTIYPEPDPFEDDFEKTEKSPDDWDQLLYFNFDNVPTFGEELPPLVCKMGKSNRNKKRSIENVSLFYQDIGPSLSAGDHLTQEEAVKEALAIRISQKFALLEEVRLVIETMVYHDKYKKILDEIWRDKVELDGKIVKEEEEAVKRIKGEALKEKDDPGAFIFPIRLEGKVNKNALADTRSHINTMAYRIYETLGREEMKKVERGITKINHTQAKAMGILTNVLCQVGVTTIIAKFIIWGIPINRDAPIVVGRGFLYTIDNILNTPERNFSTFDGICHQTFRATRFDVLRTAKSDSDDEEEYPIKRNKFGASIYGLKPAPYLNCNDPTNRSLALQAVINPIQEEATGQWRAKIRLTDPYGNIYLQRDLDTTTLKELIDSESRLIPEDQQPDVPRVGIPRPLRASMQELYDRMVPTSTTTVPAAA